MQNFVGKLVFDFPATMLQTLPGGSKHEEPRCLLRTKENEKEKEREPRPQPQSLFRTKYKEEAKEK